MAWLSAIIVAVPLLYFVSIGPYVYFQAKGWLRKPFVASGQKFYAPLNQLCRHPAMNGAVNTYATWWLELAMGRHLGKC